MKGRYTNVCGIGKRPRMAKQHCSSRGARRVGKSTIAEEFAKREYASHIVVDFANAPKGVWEAVDNIADLDNFFFQLQFIYKTKLEERKSVVIFDEIQKAPLVRQAIKYMVRDHRYDFIETGSLLSIKKTQKASPSPVKRRG